MLVFWAASVTKYPPFRGGDTQVRTGLCNKFITNAVTSVWNVFMNAEEAVPVWEGGLHPQ